MPRQLKLTDDLIERIAEAREKGHNDSSICATLAIPRSTFQFWKGRGKKSRSGRYWLFWSRYQEAGENLTHILLASAVAAATKVQHEIHEHTHEEFSPDGVLTAIKRDRKVTYKPPDGGLALKLLEKRERWDWGPRRVDPSEEESEEAIPGRIRIEWREPPDRDADGNVIEPDENR